MRGPSVKAEYFPQGLATYVTHSLSTFLPTKLYLDSLSEYYLLQIMSEISLYGKCNKFASLYSKRYLFHLRSGLCGYCPTVMHTELHKNNFCYMYCKQLSVLLFFVLHTIVVLVILLLLSAVIFSVFIYFFFQY